VTQNSTDAGARAGRDSDERISLSDVSELDADDIQPVTTPSSTPPPPPKEALQHVVVPRLAPLSSDSLAPPRVPASSPPPDPEVTATSTAPSPRRARAKKDEDESDDRDVVDIRWVLAAAVLLAVLIGTWTLARRGEPRLIPSADPERVTLTLSGVPSGARVELDGRPVSGSELTVRGGGRHAVEVHAEGHETWRQVFITRGQLELVVQLVASAESAPPHADLPTGLIAPEVEADVAAPLVAPPVAEPLVEEVVERPLTRPTTTSEMRPTTTSEVRPSTTSMSSSTSTMRSTHTLVRDPGF